MYQRLLEVKEKGFARVTNPSLIQKDVWLNPSSLKIQLGTNKTREGNNGRNSKNKQHTQALNF